MRNVCQLIRCASCAHCSRLSGALVSSKNGTSGKAAPILPSRNASSARVFSGSCALSHGLPISQAKKASCHAACGRGCTILTISASDGILPTDACNKRSSLAFCNQRCTSFFGRVPSERRPVTPLRNICTKLRSIRPLLITRANTTGSSAEPRAARMAVNSAGISFIIPRSRP